MNDLPRIRQAVRTSAFDEALAVRLGLNTTDLRCLEELVEEPGLTAGRLAELSGLTSGAITGVLDRLERSGFITRRPDPADRRRVAVELVPKRVAELAAYLDPLDAALGQALSGYDKGQRGAITGFLGKAGDVVAVETARIQAATRGGFVGDAYQAPLAGASHARLWFSSGAPRMAVNVAPLGPRAAARVIVEPSSSRLRLASGTPDGQLVGLSFDGPRPEVRSTAGSVEVRYRRRAIAAFSSRSARISLSSDIPWSIQLDGGLTDLTGDLSGIELERLAVDGGANHLDLTLPRPRGTVVVSLGGVASKVRLRRPAGVPVALRIAGGVSHLTVDGQRTEQVGGKRRFVGPGFDAAPDRYEFEILGGANRVSVGVA